MTVFLADTVAPNRATAKWWKVTRFNTGQPCTNGHRADRYTHNADCMECARERKQRRSASRKSEAITP
jgi:hypothetical protein